MRAKQLRHCQLRLHSTVSFVILKPLFFFILDSQFKVYVISCFQAKDLCHLGFASPNFNSFGIAASRTQYFHILKDCNQRYMLFDITLGSTFGCRTSYPAVCSLLPVRQSFFSIGYFKARLFWILACLV